MVVTFVNGTEEIFKVPVYYYLSNDNYQGCTKRKPLGSQLLLFDDFVPDQIRKRLSYILRNKNWKA